MNLTQAISFAATAHAGQLRKFTGLPYITHPLAVAELVRTYGGNENQVRAAILHDVVEDTIVPPDMIRERFGAGVAFLVKQCTRTTHCSIEEDVDFWARRAIPAAMLVKLADIVDNTNDVRDLDPEYAKVYLPKKHAVVVAMGRAMRGHPLFERAMAQTR